MSSEHLGSEEMMGASGAEGHIRTISLTLLRLQSKIGDPFNDLKADLQVCSLLQTQPFLRVHTLVQRNPSLTALLRAGWVLHSALSQPAHVQHIRTIPVNVQESARRPEGQGPHSGHSNSMDARMR